MAAQVLFGKGNLWRGSLAEARAHYRLQTWAIVMGG
jgi:hypothetical protein